MTKDEKKKAAFERMTAEQRKEAEAKAKARAEKKAAAAKAAQKAPYEPNMAEKLAAKRQFLKELSLYFKAVQLGRAEYKPAILEAMKKNFRSTTTKNCASNTLTWFAPLSSSVLRYIRTRSKRKLPTSLIRS